MDLFQSSGKWEEKTPTQLGPLERANLNHWKPEDGNRSSFRNVVFSSLENTGRWKSKKKTVILCVIRHRQNPSEYTLWASLQGEE
jgi:hypothetical protein